MSHLKERKEKNCLNCNAEVMGTYCHVCGQENIEPKESALHLVKHFFEDITHFDGKFFTSLKYLITKPGFLSREYMNGRRASYLNPVRMYVFTSAIFFLVFFFVNHPEDRKMDEVVKLEGTSIKSIKEIKAMGTASFAAFTSELNEKNGRARKPMTRAEFESFADSVSANGLANFSDVKYKSNADYDSAQSAAPTKDNWLIRKFMHKSIELNEKYKGSDSQMFSVLFGGLLHRLPQMMFISLPLLALILKMLYKRHRQFYFVSHGIFGIHLYIFLFIDILVIMAFNGLYAWLHWGILNFVSSLLGFAAFFYMYKAMRNFYQQRRFKTILKFLLLNILNFFLLVILFLVFLVFSFFTV